VTAAPRIPGTLFLHNLVERRSLLFQLVRRDFEQRFVGSAMGWIWGLIHPLVLLISWTFVFQFFPAEMIPVSVFLSSLVSHLLGVALMMAAAGIFLNQISVYLLLLPVYIVVVGLLSIGIGWIAASLHVFLRDTAQVVSVVLLFWFWMTPIFIAPKSFPRWAHFLLVVNPFYYVVRAYRKLLLGSAMPSLTDLAIVAAYGAAAFVIGGLFFRYMKKGFADVL